MPTPQLFHRCSYKPTQGNAWTVEPRLEAATYMNMDLPMEDIVKKVVKKAEQRQTLSIISHDLSDHNSPQSKMN